MIDTMNLAIYYLHLYSNHSPCGVPLFDLSLTERRLMIGRSMQAFWVQSVMTRSQSYRYCPLLTQRGSHDFETRLQG